MLHVFSHTNGHVKKVYPDFSVQSLVGMECLGFFCLLLNYMSASYILAVNPYRDM